MKNSELDEILKGAAVPERTAEYWQQFPRQVMAQLQEREAEARVAKPATARRLRARGIASQPGSLAAGDTAGLDTCAAGWWRVGRGPAFAIGLAAVCIVFGFALGFWKGRLSPATDPQLAEIQKCFREIQSLFPNQLQAIVFDQQGARLVLAEKADVPASPPLYIRVSGPKGCQRFVTFSGQQIQINGDVLDVLVDRRGDVLLVGAQWVWSSSQPAAPASGYRIEARPLSANS